MADVGMQVAALIVVIIFSAIGGWVVFYSCKGIQLGKINCNGCCGSIKIPTLLGMLAGGCIAMQAINPLIKEVNPEWSLIIRKAALTIILLRAGLELDLVDLKKKSCAVILLTVMP